MPDINYAASHLVMAEASEIPNRRVEPTALVEAAVRRGRAAKIVCWTYEDMTALPVLTDGAVIQVCGRAAVGDGGEGDFYYDAGSAQAVDGGAVLAHDSLPGRLIRLDVEIARLKWWCAGDGTEDDTTPVRNAFNFVEGSSRSRLLLGTAGVYRTTGPVVISEGVNFMGVGATAYRNAPTSAAAPEAGCWFHFDHDGLGLVFGNQGGTSTRVGGLFTNFGTRRNQPDPDVGWEPNDNDYDIFIDDGQCDLEKILFWNPTKGVGVDGASGRCTFKDLRMHAFDLGVDIIRASGKVRIENLHLWPHWELEDSFDDIKAYTFANCRAIRTARADQPSFKSIFAIYCFAVWEAIETAAGHTGGVKISDFQGDNCKHLIRIDASNVTDRVDAQIVNAKMSGFTGGSGTTGIEVAGRANLTLVNTFLRRMDTSFVNITGGADSYVKLNGFHGEDWNNSGGGFAALRAVPAGSTIELIGAPDISDGDGAPLYGGASGRFIIPDKTGSVTATTNASGEITLAHDLGRVPTFADVQMLGANARKAQIYNTMTDTSLTFKVIDMSGAAVASTSVSFTYKVSCS